MRPNVGTLFSLQCLCTQYLTVGSIVLCLLQIVGVIIIHSRIAEVEYEIKFGEKKDLSQWASRANLLDRSGANTPSARTPGTRTPVG